MSAPLGWADLQVGQAWRSGGRTLTETELSLFAMLTGDRHPIHVDAEYSRSARFGQRLFHGTFGIAIAVAMATELPQLREPVVAATGVDGWRFLAPLFIGDTVHVEVELTGLGVPQGGKVGVLERRIRLVKQDGAVAQQGTSGLMVTLAAAA
ncbi:MaoC/PaaZ C-terminal domain-containing protein [Variovorax defluvii]|uniref:MaoC/PaaZ C-terminal domain-containing protein n=1 Tax=Variovorax defluvii TaxID=913761 RepID=A0ABP8ICB3_9BURK